MENNSTETIDNKNTVDINLTPKNNECLICGTRLEDILKQKTVGCANCYRVFYEEIKNLILEVQKDTKNIGIVPSKHFSKVKIREKIDELERKKQVALSDENFILADSLKNQIEKLKGEL